MNTTNKTKYVLPTVLVLFILVVGYFGYKYFKQNNQSSNQITNSPISSATSDTTNWKTFAATGIYQISYPSDLYSAKSNPTSSKASWPGVITIYPNDSFNNKQPLGATYSVSVAIFNNTNKLSIDQPAKLFGNGGTEYSPSTEEIKKITETTLGGQKAYRLDNLPYGSAGVTSDIVTIKDYKIYEIQVLPVQSSGNQEVNKQVYEQILSTFKFINKTTDTSNWKTYTNTAYNYSVKYPLTLTPVAGDASKYGRSFTIVRTGPGSPIPSAFYISAIPDGFIPTSSPDQIISGYLPSDIINKLLNSKVGENVQTDLKTGSPYTIYTKILDTNPVGVLGLERTTVENTNVFGHNNLTDRRVIFREGSNVYVLGTYYTSADELGIFQAIISTFKFTK